MDFNDNHKRDGYDLQYNRSTGSRFPSAPEYADPRLGDPQLLKYSKLEKQVGEIVNDWNFALNEESKELRSILDEAHFLFQRLKEVNPGSILNTSPPMFLPLGFEPRRDATNELTVLYNRKKEAERHRDELSQKLESLLIAKSQTFQGVKGEQGDTLLYRVQVHPYSCSWSQQPHRSAYNPSGTKKYPLGYRCSGWDSCSPITNNDIINHMNKVKVGTPLISVSESPDRLIKILDQISRGDEHATVIEVFSLWMLQHIGVLHDRSTDICDKRGIQRVNGEDVPGAARWTTDTHWLVLYWIPDEAVVARMTPQEFRAAARNPYLAKADFPKASLVNLRNPIQTPNHVSQLSGQFGSLGLSSGYTPQGAIDLTIASETHIGTAEQATTGTSVPTAGNGLFSSFEPTPRPPLSFANGPYSTFATGTATAGATAPSTFDNRPFGQATTGTSIPPAGTGTPTATGGGGFFGQATMGTYVPAVSTGGLFGQVPTAGGGGLFGQARMERGASTATGGRLFDPAATGTNSTAGGGNGLYGQAPTWANAPTGSSGGQFWR